MKKVLVADLMGTLIPDSFNVINYLYGDGTFLSHSDNPSYQQELLDETFRHLANYLKDFFSDGNSLNIVTEVKTKMSVGFLMEQFVMRLYESVPGFEEKLNVFFRSDYIMRDIRDFEGSSVITDFTQDSIQLVNGASVKVIDRKSDVVDKIDFHSQDLYAVGDNYHDLEMMMRVYNQGGQIDLVDYNLFLKPISLKKLIAGMVAFLEALEAEKIASLIDPNFCKKNYSQRWQVIYGILRKRRMNGDMFLRRQDLIAKAYKGELNLKTVEERNLVYEAIEQYNYYSGFFGEYRGNISFDMIDSIHAYPTFGDYYARVLKK